ncbi:MAG: hypothetical protein NUV65_02535 [Candidatus Roizmanbacteria bacterium]|nr:hypothetical protein [Candidatus Roizmanbacteria bacterium]
MAENKSIYIFGGQAVGITTFVGYEVDFLNDTLHDSGIVAIGLTGTVDELLAHLNKPEVVDTSPLAAVVHRVDTGGFRTSDTKNVVDRFRQVFPGTPVIGMSSAPLPKSDTWGDVHFINPDIETTLVGHIRQLNQE